jgi:thioredoxin reductase
MDYFRYVPEPLARLRGEKVSHAAEHHDLQKFRGQRVAVVGGGSSALDLSVLLSEAQADVHLIARKPTIDFGKPWGRNSPRLRTQIRYPVSGIGPGWKQRILADLPWLYRYLPDSYRLRIAQTFLGPQGQWAMRDRANHISLHLGYAMQNASASGQGIRLDLDSIDGTSQSVEVDHVISATGYRPDVNRFPFLDPVIRDRLRMIGKTPRLSRNYESSVPGLYFVGPISATTFGPVMRFVFGAGFASRKLAGHIAMRA